MTRSVPIWSSQGVAAHALVDDADYDAVVAVHWCLTAAGYAYRTSKHRGAQLHVLMHRELLGLQRGDGREVDHINGNRLDNRRSNLRVVTRQVNQQNRRGGNAGSTSAYRGVSLDRQTGRWRAQAMVGGRNHTLGRYPTEQQAAAVASDFRARTMVGAVEGADS